VTHSELCAIWIVWLALTTGQDIPPEYVDLVEKTMSKVSRMLAEASEEEQ
jgi:hypothetical protein